MTAYERWCTEREECHCLHPSARVCFERANPAPCDDMEFGDYVAEFGDADCECGCHCVFMEEEELREHYPDAQVKAIRAGGEG